MALRVAIIGAGNWGAQHVRAFSARDDVEIVGVYSRKLANAERRAQVARCRAYDDIDAMLDAETPDLVSICLPNTHHYEPTLQVIRRGFPIFAEKPLVFGLDEARQLLREAEERRLFFAINFNHRFATAMLKAKAAIDDGQVGELSFATWRFGGEGDASSGPDGNLIETQCHGLDLLEHLAGPIEAVSAEMTNRPGRGHSTMSVALKFASGAVGSLIGSYDTSYAYPGTCTLELDGSAGRVVVTDTVRRFELTRAGEETRQVWEAGYFNDRDRSFHVTFDAHLDRLIPALLAGDPPPVPATAGYRALLLAHCIIESERTGTRVTVE